MKRLFILLFAGTIALASNAQFSRISNAVKQQTQSSQKKDEPKRVQQTPAAVQVLYVSKSTGKNKNDGSKEAPLKNIQKAVEMAQPGALIRVAEGNYFGNLDCGTIDIRKPVTIEGGWNSDFSERILNT